MAAQNLSIHPWQGMGLVKRDLGAAPSCWMLPHQRWPWRFFEGFTHGKSGFWWDGPPVLLLWGVLGDCGSPFPGFFVPQPLEATETLCSQLIYSGRTFGHTLAPKNLKRANPQRQQNWGKQGREGLSLSSAGVSRASPTPGPHREQGHFPQIWSSHSAAQTCAEHRQEFRVSYPRLNIPEDREMLPYMQILPGLTGIL